MIGSALSHMERKYGGFKRITDYSLQVYGCLSEAEENSKKVQVDRKANTGVTAAAADRSRIVFPKNWNRGILDFYSLGALRIKFNRVYKTYVAWWKYSGEGR